MDKMLFQFDYLDDTIYCVADVYESFIKNCRVVHLDALYCDYSFSTSLMLYVDEIEDVHTFQVHVFQKITRCIDSFYNESYVFKKNWNLYCDSVPRVYQFEKETLYNDSSISKFNLSKTK